MPTRSILFRSILVTTALFCVPEPAICAQDAGNEPDKIPTNEGNLTVHPINHATLALKWKDLGIYVDPVGGKKAFEGLPAPGLILITDIHQDHLNADTLNAVIGPQTALVTSPAVAEQLPEALRSRAKALPNGQSHTWSGIKIEAVPAYNVTPDRLKFHAKGRGNGYLLTLGGKRIYISGDTEPTPEMLALKDIDVAFLCMNLPYTMTVEQAAEAVKSFKPKIVYPYHYRGSDLQKFKSLVGNDAGVDVRLKDWYAKR